MRLFLLLMTLAAIATPAAAEDWITTRPGGMALVGPKGAADIVYDDADAAVVGLAAHDLAADIERVTGRPASIGTEGRQAQQVWIGTLGQSRAIANINIDTSALKDCWECYLITTIKHPKPGVDQALVIIGSDRRGTAYGIYEVSEAIGVSPWYWWADIMPLHRNALYVKAGMRKFGPPSVKYRGIFINDEDWGLQPWAAKTFDQETGNIGPKTYGKVFELLLRLKANTLWPAMHKVSAPFNAAPENAKLADRYAIVMGSSHAEPMLRNNVGEWTAPPEDFNFARNPDGVSNYWRERLKTNGRFENIYTLGMRGIHDSGIVGADTQDGCRDLLNRIIATQRRMLGEEVGAPETLPQIFVPYKEVLDIYHGGLNLPDDVTVVWPDDNFGYIRHFPDAAEQKRSGGSGVYYHLSYLGAPMAYLWLSTTPPALIKAEMTRAYDAGADRIWIANVGDIKPAEVDISYFMDLAWDVPGVRKQSQRQWLTDFAGRTFGAEVADELGGIWDNYYVANFIRRPEHLQWNLPKQPPASSPYGAGYIDQRLKGLDVLVRRTDEVARRLPVEQQSGFFELAGYPVRAAALANHRYFTLECQYTGKPCGTGDAHVADAELKTLTMRYGQLENGKWAGLIREEPADDDWKSMRIGKSLWPETGGAMVVTPVDNHLWLEPKAGPGWERIDGIGHAGWVMRAVQTGAPLTQVMTLDGPKQAVVSILPNFPADNGGEWRLDVQINDGPRQTLRFERGKQDALWARGVLDNRLTSTIPVALPGGKVSIRLYASQPGLIVESLSVQ